MNKRGSDVLDATGSTDLTGELAAIVLAAGASTRFGEADKLLHKVNGVPLIEHTLKLLQQFSFSEVIVVGSQVDGRLQKLADQYQSAYVQNQNAEDGMGTSISAGVEALNAENVYGVAIFLGDMPFLGLNEIERLISTFRSHGASKIVRPVFDIKPGHPVIFPASLFYELTKLSDDSGAKSVIRKHNHLLETVSSNTTCVCDIDRVSDLPK